MIAMMMDISIVEQMTAINSFELLFYAVNVCSWSRY